MALKAPTPPNVVPPAAAANKGGSAAKGKKAAETAAEAPPATTGTKRKKGAAAAATAVEAASPSKDEPNKKTKRGGKKAAPPSEPTSPAYDGMSDDDELDGSVDMSEHGGDEGSTKNKGGRGPKQQFETEEDKRKNFLERNRQAALKCRQRKKQWLNSLQSKVEYLTTDNETLTATIQQLREEIGTLRNILMSHKDCPLSNPGPGGPGAHTVGGMMHPGHPGQHHGPPPPMHMHPAHYGGPPPQGPY